MPRRTDEAGTGSRWGMFPGMSQKPSMQADDAESVAPRSQLAVRVPKTTLRSFKLTCVRAGITMQDGVEEALLRWVRDRESEAVDE